MLIAMPRLLIATPVPVDMSLVHLTARNSPLRSYLFCMDRPFLPFYIFPVCRNTARSTVHCSRIVCRIPVCSRIYPFSFPPVLYHSIFWSGREESGYCIISFQIFWSTPNAPGSQTLFGTIDSHFLPLWDTLEPT